MSRQQKTPEKGQALVEFALVIMVLLMVLFVVIEAARIMQAQLTITNAARAGARYGITGDYFTDCLPGCADPRVWSVRKVTRDTSTGLVIDDGATYEQPKYYYVEVWGTDADGNLLENYAGAAGMPMVVRVIYRLPIITPILSGIAPSLQLSAQTVLINENYSQFVGTQQNVNPPELPPIPTVGPSPTPTLCPIDILESYLVTTDTQLTVAGKIGDTVRLRVINPNNSQVAGPFTFAAPAAGNCSGSYVFTGLDLTDKAGWVLQAIGNNGTSDFVEIVATAPTATATGTETATPTNTPVNTATPTPTPTSTATNTPTSTPSTAFIMLNPNCGSYGNATSVTVSGFNWPTSPGNKDLILYWEGVGGTELERIVNMNSPTWQIGVIIPTGSVTGTHQIYAQRPGASGQPGEIQFATYTIPCAVTPTATPTSTPTHTATPLPTDTPTATPVPADLIIGPLNLVGAQPVTAYQPVDFTVVVTNTGEVDINSQFFVSLYFDPSPVPTGTDTFIPSQFQQDIIGVSNLASLNSRAITLTAGAGFTGTVTHTVYALVDSAPVPTGLIVEGAEDNNISAGLTVSVTAGAAPTATPTPAVETRGSMGGIGHVWLNSSMVEQFNIEVRAIYDDGGGNAYVVDTQYTDADGIYLFPSLPATDLAGASYTLVGCITLDGISYSGSFAGVALPPDQLTVVNLYLFAGVCP